MSDLDQEPFLTPPGWNRSALIAHAGGPTYRVLFYEDGTARFEHRCDRGERGTVVCAPLLGSGHVVQQDEPLTVTPSVLCPDCGTHGFIRNSRWLPA